MESAHVKINSGQLALALSVTQPKWGGHENWELHSAKLRQWHAVVTQVTALLTVESKGKFDAQQFLTDCGIAEPEEVA